MYLYNFRESRTISNCELYLSKFLESQNFGHIRTLFILHLMIYGYEEISHHFPSVKLSRDQQENILRSWVPRWVLFLSNVYSEPSLT